MTSTMVVKRKDKFFITFTGGFHITLAINSTFTTFLSFFFGATTRRLECDGEAPSPRVWHSACQAVHGQWPLGPSNVGLQGILPRQLGIFAG